MNARITPTIDFGAFEESLRIRFTEVAAQVEARMAETFYNVVMNNFGFIGEDRPINWARLSPEYAKRVKREYATLYVTGALKGAVKLEGNTVSVSNDSVPYAMVHMFGGGNNIPKRPYFPIDDHGGDWSDGECLPWTMDRMTDAAQVEIGRLFS